MVNYLESCMGQLTIINSVFSKNKLQTKKIKVVAGAQTSQYLCVMLQHNTSKS